MADVDTNTCHRGTDAGSEDHWYREHGASGQITLACRSSTMHQTSKQLSQTGMEIVMLVRRILPAALAVGALLGATAPGASASTLPTPTFGLPTGAFPPPGYAWSSPPLDGNAGAVGSGSGGICGSSSATQGGIGGSTAGGTTAQVCLGPGALSFVGPSIGEVSSIVGPTIIGPANNVNVIQSAG
jgi:hypothetical protein